MDFLSAHWGFSGEWLHQEPCPQGLYRSLVPPYTGVSPPCPTRPVNAVLASVATVWSLSHLCGILEPVCALRRDTVCSPSFFSHLGVRELMNRLELSWVWQKGHLQLPPGYLVSFCRTCFGNSIRLWPHLPLLQMLWHLNLKQRPEATRA